MTMIATLPSLITLCVTLWRAPFPIREATGQFEDIADRHASAFLVPTLSYYRPLFHLSLWTVWHGASSIDGALRAIKLFHVVPITLLVLLFIWILRPRSALEAAVATAAVAVLVGAPAFLGNLEPPLSYTIVGMPAALVVWMLLERDYRAWHGPAIVVLTLIAIGFKEQGLAIVPLVLVARWMGAPGTGRFTAVVVTIVAVGYVAFRVAHQSGTGWPPFEQDVGFLFSGLSSNEATERFGAFPVWIYLYNAASTVSNVLLSEPTDGRFRFVLAFVEGRVQPWHIVYVASSLALTTLIVWWGFGALKARTARRWSMEARLFVAVMVVLATSGALSFDYSRDRLGGMVIPFYALATFFAIRQAAERLSRKSMAVAAVGATSLLLLAGAWQCRALYTIEFTRQRSVNGHREWLTDLYRRRTDYATRPMYLHVLESMVDQGTDPARVVHPTRYPSWMRDLLGEF
jgi:hypothetical protein